MLGPRIERLTRAGRTLLTGVRLACRIAENAQQLKPLEENYGTDVLYG